MDKEQIDKKRKEKWFELMFTIEALAIEKEIVEKSLKTHVEKLNNVKNVFVYETEFLDTIKVEKPLKNVEEAHSSIVKLKLFIRDLPSLIHVVMAYGPSSVEVIGPKKIEVDLYQIQDITNLLSGIVHQFAAAGVGGIIITPDK